MTTPTPTPNNMPGAQSQGEPNPQLQQPVTTGQQPPAPQAPPAAPAQQTPPAQQPPAPQTPPAKDEPKQDTDWKTHARTWEQRARENEEKAKKYEEWEAKQRTQAENDRIAIENERKARLAAEEQLARERVARTTGVEPEFLGGGTEEDMRARAQALLEWRGAQQNPPAPPPPQTSAAPASTVSGGAVPIGTSPNGIQQLTIDQFRALPDHEKTAAMRAGQCESLGIGKLKAQRRMGNEIEVGAHGGRQ